MKKLIILTSFVGSILISNAQIISTVAGNGSQGYSGDGGQATQAELYHPAGVGLDTMGNIFIADYDNNSVRKVNASSGIISTVAGNGTSGYSGDGGQATAAELWGLYGVCVDKAGNIYISDGLNNRIRKVTASTGIISTIAGNGSNGYSGDGGPAISAELNSPNRVALDVSGNLYIGDQNNNRIRKVNSSGTISTIAGNGAAGYSGDGGQATLAELNQPHGVVLDASGNIYIADDDNNRIRKINSSGTISTIAGNGAAGYYGDGGQATSAELNYPGGVSLDKAGNVYIADANNSVIRELNVSNGIISTIIGNRVASYSGDGGPATAAELNFTTDVTLDASGNIYVADQFNNRIRKTSALSFPCVPNITTGLVAEYTFSGNANDVSGNGNNGTVYGCTLVPDRFGNPNSAYSFNGISDSIVVPNSPSLQFTSDNQSISFWMKVPSIPNPTLNNEGIFDKFNENLLIDNTGNSAMGFYVVFGQFGNGTMDYSVKNGSTSPWGTATTSNTLLTANQWENVVYVYNSVTDTIYSYLNGVLNYSTQIPVGTSIGQNTQPFLIGKSRWMNNGNPSYLFTGILDDIRIYDLALTPCSVDSLYNMPNLETGVKHRT